MKKSESTVELAKALAKFQGEIKDPSKSGKANYGKYVTLDELLESIRPVLSQNGLSFLQFPGGDGQVITITTMLLHTSGEWIESEPFSLKPQKVDPQGAGSAVTYGRRYSLSAILGVAWDADDDGQAASHTVVQKTEAKAEQKKEPKTEPVKLEYVKFSGTQCLIQSNNGKWYRVEDLPVKHLESIMNDERFAAGYSAIRATINAKAVGAK